MVSCAACGYSQTDKNKLSGITFHHFPKDEKRRKRWLKIIKDENWIPKRRSVLCSHHFSPECFDRSSKLKVRLFENAVPTIEVTRLKYVRTFNEAHKTKIDIDTPNNPEPDSHTSDKRKILVDTHTSPNTTNHENIFDSPRKKRLKQEIYNLKKIQTLQKRKIIAIQKVCSRQKIKIRSLKVLLAQLKKKHLLLEEQYKIIVSEFDGKEEMISLFENMKNKRKTYDPLLRKFAVTLHFYSPRGYAYVRQKFCNSLPHPKTLSKWYSSIEAKPGFTVEAIEFLKSKVAIAEKPVICSLMFDEVAIRRHIEYDGKNYYGYTNFGTELQNTTEMAKEALVFMLVAINDSWKLPFGYFYISGLNSEQKAALIRQCLTLLKDIGVKVPSITFDGCVTNFTTFKLLGCDFNIYNLKTYFILDDTKYFAFPDPSHMIKCIRNCFCEKQILHDDKMEIINFAYLLKLNNLQEEEGLHLCNKLRKQHIQFFKQKMKVKLATQLLSKSVADALNFCKENLKLREFRDCGATAKFILLMNNAFDILNCRTLRGFDFKQALYSGNYNKFERFFEQFKLYVLKLRLSDGTYIVNSNRKTGFLGFIISLNSALQLFKEYVTESNILQFLPLYKLSQDHLELFFSTIRSQGGYNNNPTCRQFTAAYKKILIHAEVKDYASGNCIPLQQINILNIGNGKKKPIDIINESLPHHIDCGIDNITSDVDTNVLNFLNDHCYALDYPKLSDYCVQIVVYIAGFIVYKLGKKLKCEDCIDQLYGKKENFCNSLIDKKSKGKLSYPNEDVINVCHETEKMFKYEQKVNNNNIIDKHTVCSRVLKVCNKRHIFSKMIFHDNNPLENHRLLLIKSISLLYIDTRIHYACKQLSYVQSVRNVYNKLVLFKGQ